MFIGRNTWSPVLGTTQAGFTIFCAHADLDEGHIQKTFSGTTYIFVCFADTLFNFGDSQNVTKKS